MVHGVQVYPPEQTVSSKIPNPDLVARLSALGIEHFAIGLTIIGSSPFRFTPKNKQMTDLKFIICRELQLNIHILELRDFSRIFVLSSVIGKLVVGILILILIFFF